MANDEEHPDTEETPASLALDLDEFFDLIDNGQLSRDVMERLRKVVAGVRETGGNGRVDLRLKVEIGGAQQVEITPILKSKEPKTSHSVRILYADDEGHLYKRDPSQQNLLVPLARRGRREDKG